jgi:hypothetical protein
MIADLPFFSFSDKWMDYYEFISEECIHFKEENSSETKNYGYS